MRENLTLTAWVKLHVSAREKFERIEQVMAVVSGICTLNQAMLLSWLLTGYMDLQKICSSILDGLA